MKLRALNSKNGHYDEKTWCEYHALYEGGRAFRSRVKSFLRQNPMEPADVYEQRCAEAHYRSYCGTIVDFFAAQLFAAPMTIRKIDAVTRESQSPPDPFYAELESDADGVGTDIVDMARNTFRKALVKRRMWWLCSLPSNDGVPPKNRAEWELRQLGRVRISEIEPEHIFDWEYDDQGKLLWVLMHCATRKRERFTDSRSRVTHTWRLYDATNITTFELSHDPDRDPALTDETDVLQIDETPHGFSQVPLTQLVLPSGLWLMNRIADTQVEHFRLESALSWGIRRTCYAMPIFKTASEQNVVMGPGYFLRIDQADDVTWLSPPSAPFDVISAEVKAKKDEIYRVSQQMAHGVDNNAAAIGRSGESKLADTNATDVCLRAYGGVMREHIERTLELVADGRKDTQTKFSVEGLDRFNLADAAIVVENALASQKLSIPSATLRKELFIQVAEALIPGLEQTKKDAIRLEIESGVDEQVESAEMTEAEEPGKAEDESSTETEDDGPKSNKAPDTAPRKAA